MRRGLASGRYSSLRYRQAAAQASRAGGEACGANSRAAAAAAPTPTPSGSSNTGSQLTAACAGDQGGRRHLHSVEQPGCGTPGAGGGTHTGREGVGGARRRQRAARHPGSRQPATAQQPASQPVQLRSEAIYTRKLCHVTAAVGDTSQFHSVNTDKPYLHEYR
jgi:hypothetical protein